MARCLPLLSQPGDFERLNGPQVSHTPLMLLQGSIIMWARAGAEATVTAWPENVTATILYAFKIGREKEKEKNASLSQWRFGQSKIWPRRCVMHYVSPS